MGRAKWTLFVLLCLGACQEEPDFDERYDSVGSALEMKAEAIDNEMAARESALQEQKQR